MVWGSLRARSAASVVECISNSSATPTVASARMTAGSVVTRHKPMPDTPGPSCGIQGPDGDIDS